MLFGDGNGGVAGRVSMAYAPRLRAVLALDAEPSAVLVARHGLGRRSPRPERRRAHAAARRRLICQRRRTAGVRPPEVWEPWREAEAADAEADGGLPRPLLAGVPAALLLGLVLVRFGRRRERS